MVNAVEPAKVLFSPFAINELTIANRIVMSPMAALGAHADGRPSEQTHAFFCERAKGGVGLIIMGGTGATRRAFAETPIKAGGVRLDEERFLPDLQRLTSAVHTHGTPIFVELVAGLGTMGKPTPTFPLIAASPKNVVIKPDQLPTGILMPFDRVSDLPQAATVEEIHALQREAAASAERAQRAGFDGVEIAAHTSYFFSSFLSPRFNWRTDEYGGGVENRARVLVELVRLIRERVGASFPIGLRISANEHVEGGQGPEGYAAIAAHVEREGIDYVALTDGHYESFHANAPDTDATTVEHGEAQIFRRALSCPLILGSVHDPQRAAEVIDAGHGDAVMLGRPLLADPEYANKVRNGRSHDVVACDRHNTCLRRLFMGMPVRCSVNPRMGRESREPGQRPPASRLIKGPIENAVLAVTGSPRMMNLAGKLARKQP